MQSFLKKVENLFSFSEKTWYTFGQILIGGIFFYIIVDVNKKLFFVPFKKKEIKQSEQNEQTELLGTPDRSPSLMDSPSPIRLSKFSSVTSKKVLKIVVTGGPRSGKTTALSSIAESLKERGFKVYVATDAAGILHQGGGNMQIQDESDLKKIKFQENLLQLQMAIEDRLTEVAMVECTNQHPGVILCDRGTMDGSAFISKEGFQTILNKIGENLINIRDNRYDGVVHLVTSANGALEFFNKGPEQQNGVKSAIEIDSRLQEIWKAHPQWYNINNLPNQSFETKMDRAIKAVFHIVGIPSSVNFYKKYLLKSFDGENGILEFLPKDLLLEQTKIEDIFLKTSGKQQSRKIRKRVEINKVQIFPIRAIMIQILFIEKQQASIKRRINSKNYYQMMEERNSSLNPIKKIRTSFMWNERLYLIDEYKLPNGTKFSVLLIFTEDGNENVVIGLPPFLQIGIVREISNESQYFPEQIAQKNWKMSESDYNQVTTMFSL